MSESPPGGSAPDAPGRRHLLVTALAVVLAVEAVGIVGAAVFLVAETLTTAAASLPSALALAVIALVAGVWVGAVARSVLARRAWARGATVVIEVLVGGLAISAFQGGVVLVGVVLLVPALAGLVLVLTPPVVAGLSDGTRRE